MEASTLGHDLACNVIQEFEKMKKVAHTIGFGCILYTDMHDESIQNETFHNAEKKPKISYVFFKNSLNSLRRGPTGPSSLAPDTQVKKHPCIIIK